MNQMKIKGKTRNKIISKSNVKNKHDKKNNHIYNNSKNQKVEILLKPFEKKSDRVERKTENAVDDLFSVNNQKPINLKTNTQPGNNYNSFGMHKEISKSKINTNLQFLDRYNKKTGGIY